MARYSHLPIWKAAMDLAVHLEHAVRRFPRYHKYSLGQDLRQCARRHPQALVFLQVGNRWVLPLAGSPAPGALPAHACEVVPGLGGCHVWRPSALPGLRQWLKRQGLAHVLVAQDGHFKTGLKRRALWLAWYPQPPGAVAGFPSFSTFSFQGVA